MEMHFVTGVTRCGGDEIKHLDCIGFWVRINKGVAPARRPDPPDVAAGRRNRYPE
jgi:hypothetical protein